MTKVKFPKSRIDPDVQEDLNVDFDFDKPTEAKEDVNDKPDESKDESKEEAKSDDVDVNTNKDKEDKEDKDNKDDKDDKPFDTSTLKKVTVETEDGEVELYESEDGNYVNDSGEVVYKKEDIEVESNPIEEFFDKTEVKVQDENGEYKKYDASLEGLKTYVEDIKNQVASEVLESNNEEVFISNLISKYPVLSDVLPHLDKYGSLDNYDASIDVFRDIKQDDLESQRAIIRKDRLAKGETVEEANGYISYLEDNEKLYNVAKSTQDRIKQDKEQYNSQIEQNKQNEFIQTWGINPKTGKPVEVEGSVRDLIFNKKEITIQDQKFKIPDQIRVKQGNSFVSKNKSEFFDYLYKPQVFDVGGQKSKMSKYQYDSLVRDSNKTMNDDLYEAFTMFTHTNPLIEQKEDLTKYNTTKNKLKVKGGTNKSTGKIALKVKRQS